MLDKKTQRTYSVQTHTGETIAGNSLQLSPITATLNMQHDMTSQTLLNSNINNSTIFHYQVSISN